MLSEEEINDKLQRLSITNNFIATIFRFMEAGCPELKAMKLAVIALAEGSDLSKIWVNEKTDTINKILNILKKYEKEIPSETMKKINEETFNVISEKIDKNIERFNDLSNRIDDGKM